MLDQTRHLSCRSGMELLPSRASPVIQPAWVLLPALLGGVALLRLSFSLLRRLYSDFLRPAKNLRDYGGWAVVTGATDGIGRAIAFELARKGLHLVLVGRSPGKLRGVAEGIEADVGRAVRVETVVADLSSGDPGGGWLRRLEEAIGGRDVGVLVNNAGTTHPRGMYLHEVSEEEWRRVVRVNLEALTTVTRAVLPGMLRRRRGAVVNIGSGASVVIPSHPFFAVYAATKAYVDSISRSLHAEYKQYGIQVQCQIPLYVATKMVPFKGSSFFTPTPRVYARWAVRYMGYEARCIPYGPHYVQACLLGLLPRALVNAWRLRHGIYRRNYLASSPSAAAT